MQFIYEPFVMRRFAEGRIFFVSPKMPFEYFLDCFQYEHPFFLVSQLDDGRIAITPNAMVIPATLLQAGFGPQDLLPNEFEYVTIKNANYPVMITAHPVPQADLWIKKFEKWVKPFTKQTLSDFVTSAQLMPLKMKKFEYKGEFETGYRPEYKSEYQPEYKPVAT